jgi:hypothetical protein
MFKQSKLWPRHKQPAKGKRATIAVEINTEELEILAKRPSSLTPPKEADVKQIDLGTSDPSKTPTINANLYKIGTRAHQISLR